MPESSSIEERTSAWAFGRNPVLRWIHGRRLASDLAIISDLGAPRRRFLDYGCGDGLIVRMAASRYERVAGVDTQEHFLAEARRRGVPANGAFGHVSELTELAARFGPFDTVSLLQVLEHVSDAVRDSIFDAIDAVCSPRAQIVVEVPIESGPILILKSVGGRTLSLMTRGSYQREPYTPLELVRRMSVRRAPHIRPPAVGENGVGIGGFGHKDFSVWNLKAYLARRYRITQLRCLPFPALRWLNLQAIFVCGSIE